MALDRGSIQKQNFPVGDGGYDRDAVDAHLSSLADQVEELQHASAARNQSLADTASDRIRAIVEGAETSAAEIQRHAVEDADRIRADAGTDAAAIRQQAKEQAHADVGKVSESTAGMMSRLEAMKSELNALFESLRTGSERPRRSAWIRSLAVSASDWLRAAEACWSSSTWSASALRWASTASRS